MTVGGGAEHVGLYEGQAMYALVFQWGDGGESWACLHDDKPSFAGSIEDDATILFVNPEAALAFLAHYGPLAGFARIEECQLRRLEDDT